MSRTDWDEVKRLAADFQRTQQTSALQKLSERNCIEIVKKLMELELVEVFFTCDGKEYITPSHLVREISDELYVSGGRIHLTDLVYNLNVDLAHIESKAAELSRESNGEISVVLGQLISIDYKDRLAMEINDKLQQAGIITIGELTKAYDLPAEFLRDLVRSRLGTTINGVEDINDSRTFFTQAYLDQYRFKIRGIMTAMTRPTPLTQVLARYKFPEKIFNTSIESLIKNGELNGSISGSGASRNYIPDIYAKTQRDYVDNFWKQSGYIEYDTLVRIGLTEPKSFLSKRFNADDIIFLKTCAVAKTLIYLVDSTIEECINTKSWQDLQPMLPSILNEQDIHQLYDTVVSTNCSLEASCLIADTVIASTAFIDSLVIPFEPLMAKKADEDLKSGLLLKVFASQNSATKAKEPEEDQKLSKKDERKKKAAGSQKSGGGQQGREVKIRSTKKKYNPNKKGGRDDSDDEQGPKSDVPDLIFMTEEQIAEKIVADDPKLKEGPDGLLDSLAERIYPLLNAKYLEVARAVFAANTFSTQQSAKKTHAELQTSLNQLNSSIYLYNKGLDVLNENEALKGQLLKLLQRSQCTEALLALILFLSSEENPNLSNPDARLKVITKLNQENRESLTKLNSSLTAATLETFFEALDESASKLDIMLKPIDKKREKVLLSENRNNLIHQMNEESANAATFLHLAVMLVFQDQYGQTLHATGKFVPQLIAHLRPAIDRELYELLHDCEQLVIKQLKLEKEPDQEEKETLEKRLEEVVKKLKETVTSKRPRKE